MPRSILSPLIGGILLYSSAALASSPLDATLARMDQTAGTFTDLTAGLVRIHHVGVINDDTRQDGIIYMKRPKPHEVLVRFDIKKPDPEQVTVDQKQAQVYLPNSKTIQIYEIAKYKKLADQLLLLGFGTTSQELQAGYTIAYGGSETLNGQKTTRIELTPKSNDAHLSKVELWISDATGLPVQQKLYEGQTGDYDVATYSDMKINTGLPESAVKLVDLPKGVKREYPQR